MAHAVTGAHIHSAATRIADHIRRTPVQTSRAIDALTGRQLVFKCENFQRGGSFKVRGALNAVAQLTEEQRAKGVLTHSSGNFAQGLAIAARTLGVRATIVMPRNAPAVKRAAVRGYGAHIVLCEPSLDSRIHTVHTLAAQTGGTVISPSNHPAVIAGQGTCALELLEDAPDIGAVVVPLGGGGLLSGVAVAIQHMAPHIAVIGAEPMGADDAWHSRQAGKRIGHPPAGPSTICDGLRTELGTHTWPIVRDCVDHVVRVDDIHTRTALRWLFERMKLVVEPSAAIALAAATLSDAPIDRNTRVGVILSGGNVDLDALPGLLAPRAPA